MEIESMNFEDSNESDNVRKLIQTHKRDFDSIRREMRGAQQSYDKSAFNSTNDQEMADLENGNTKLLRQRRQLEDAKETGYAM